MRILKAFSALFFFYQPTRINDLIMEYLVLILLEANIEDFLKRSDISGMSSRDELAGF